MSSTDISNILKQLDELAQPKQLPALFKPQNISPVLGSPEKKNPMSGYFVGGEGAEPDAKPVWYAIRHRDTGHTLGSHKDEAAARDEMAGLGDRRQEYKLVKTSRRPNQFGLDEEGSGGQQYAVTIDAIDHGVLSPITVTASSPAEAKQKAIASATASMAKRGYELQVRSAAVKTAQGIAEGTKESLAQWEERMKKLGYKITKNNKTATYHAWEGTTHKGSYNAHPVREGVAEGFDSENNPWHVTDVDAVSETDFEVALQGPAGIKLNFVIRPVDFVETQHERYQIDAMDVRDLQSGKTMHWGSLQNLGKWEPIFDAIDEHFWMDQSLQAHLAKIVNYYMDAGEHGKNPDMMPDLDKRDPNGIAVPAKDFVSSRNQSDTAIKSAKKGMAEATGDEPFDKMMGKITGGADARQGVDSLNKSLTARTGSNPETALAKWGQEFIKWLEDICRNFAKQGVDRVSKLENLGNLDDGGETMAHWLIKVAKQSNTSGITLADIQEFSSEFNTHGMWAWQHFPIAWSQGEWQDYKDQWTGPDGYIASLGQGVAEGSHSESDEELENFLDSTKPELDRLYKLAKTSKKAKAAYYELKEKWDDANSKLYGLDEQGVAEGSVLDTDTTGYTKYDMDFVNNEINQIKKIQAKLLKIPGFTRKVNDKTSQLQLAEKIFNLMKRGHTFDGALVLAQKNPSQQGVAEGMNDWALKDKPKVKSIPQTSGMNSYAMKGDVHNKAYDFPPTHYDNDGKNMYGQQKPELKSQTEGASEAKVIGHVGDVAGHGKVVQCDKCDTDLRDDHGFALDNGKFICRSGKCSMRQAKNRLAAMAARGEKPRWRKDEDVAEGSSSPDEYKRRLASIQSLRYDNPQEYAKQYRALLQAMPGEHAAHANQAQKANYSPGQRGSGTGSTGRVAEEASPMIAPPSNRFDSKQEAFAHAKAHGGKVFKSTYTDPNTGNKNVSFVVKKDQDVEEGWKQKLGAAALAGSMAMGANARVVPGQDEPGVNRLTGKPNIAQVAAADSVPDSAETEKPSFKGFSTSYLQKAADPNRFGRFLISVENAKAELAAREAAYQKRAQGVDEVAPPGARAERMVKHIKQGYAKDGKLTGKEKAIAYATTWKAHNQGQVEEASADLVGFHLDTERAYNAVMERFGDVVEQDQESGMMTVPRRYWLQLEQVAHDADGIGAIEAGGENIAVDEVEESYWQPQIDEAIAQEDVLDKEKRHLGDYLQSVADAVKHDAALSSKDTPVHSSDTIGSAVKTVTTDDGHDLKIHGNEDDGFRISIKGRPSKVKFKSLDEAGMACEMYRSHRRHKLESADYIEEQ